MKSFYVYEHWRPDIDLCFYVGKGHGDRYRDFRRGRNKHHRSICRKLSRLGMCVEVRMVSSGMTESEAFALEVQRISFWRSSGVRLANKTDGGEGASGTVVSKATRSKHSEHSKRRWQDPSYRQTMNNKRRPELTDEFRLKLSDAQKKRFADSPDDLARATEHCIRLALARKGKPGRALADWEIEALRARRIGVKASAETRSKQSTAKLGKPRKPFTEETLAKMRAAAAAREQAKRDKFGTEVRRHSRIKECPDG